MSRPRPGAAPDDDRTVATVGEFGVIDRVVARAGTAAATLVGPGDDAAVVRAPDARVVASTDVLVEGRHFRRDWSSAEDVGHKAAAANLADVAAGRAAECAPHGPALGGGDTVASAPDSASVVLSVTVLGDLQGRAPVTRGGARVGDVVAVAGRLGWAACGWAVLRRGFTSPHAAVAAHRRPEPPYAAGPAAADAGATAMCDVSDGLLADAGHLADASGVVLHLDRGTLASFVTPDGPLAQVAAALGGDPLGWVLTGGEDHAILATFPAAADLPAGFVRIGVVEHGAPGVLVDGVAAADVAEGLGERSGHVHF